MKRLFVLFFLSTAILTALWAILQETKVTLPAGSPTNIQSLDALAAAHSLIAQFWIRVSVASATLCAVLLALFRDAVQKPIRVTIEKVEEPNDVFDIWEAKKDYEDDLSRKTLPKSDTKYKAYCHHLRVKNLTPHRPIEDCQVWLKDIYSPGVEGDDWKNWKRSTTFAVRRLMEWAPSEYSRTKRTFSNEDLFDLGVTLSGDAGFVLAVGRRQGGTLYELFSVGHKRMLVFVVKAKNYQQEEEFFFDVEVLKSSDGGATPNPAAKVTPISRRQASERTKSEPI